MTKSEHEPMRYRRRDNNKPKTQLSFTAYQTQSRKNCELEVRTEVTVPNRAQKDKEIENIFF